MNPAQQGALLELAELAYDNGAYADAQGYRLRLAAVARPTARSLWLCVRLARILADREEEAQCGRALGAFPASDEYRSYQESR